MNNDCPVCNSKNVILKWPIGLIEMENCESDIAEVKRKSLASSICLTLLQDGLCAPIESLIDTCPVVPKKLMRKFKFCIVKANKWNQSFDLNEHVLFAL